MSYRVNAMPPAMPGARLLYDYSSYGYLLKGSYRSTDIAPAFAELCRQPLSERLKKIHPQNGTRKSNRLLV